MYAHAEGHLDGDVPIVVVHDVDLDAHRPVQGEGVSVLEGQLGLYRSRWSSVETPAAICWDRLILATIWSDVSERWPMVCWVRP